jgi:hypothetical protein
MLLLLHLLLHLLLLLLLLFSVYVGFCCMHVTHILAGQPSLLKDKSSSGQLASSTALVLQRATCCLYLLCAVLVHQAWRLSCSGQDARDLSCSSQDAAFTAFVVLVLLLPCRRDVCPAVSKMLEACLRSLFTSRDLSAVKDYCTRQWAKILSNRVSVQV